MKIFASDIAQSKLFHIAHLYIDLQKNSSLFLNSLPSFGQIPPETPRIFLSKWEFEVYTPFTLFAINPPFSDSCLFYLLTLTGQNCQCSKLKI